MMRQFDEADAASKQRSAAKRRNGDGGPDVNAALAQPKQASVQAMLEVQRLAGNTGMNQLLAREEDGSGGTAQSPVLDVVGKGGGAPLDAGLKTEMEGRLGADFSDVRVHTDAKASESAKAVQANAYTVGSDVVVRSDRWSPSTATGKETIAHELTHVVQQRSGPVDGTSTGDGISVSHPSDRFERAAEQNARQALAGPAPAAGTSVGASAQLHADHDLQREAAPEDEEAQMQRAVQREAAPEDEEAQMQREAAPEDEEAQMQREAAPEDEEAQMQREEEEEETAQTQRTAQREAAPEEEEPAAG